MFIACLKKATSFLKLKTGSACVIVLFVTRTDFALTPLSEEDNETDEAVRSLEGVYYSVSEFLEACRRDQDMPMPAVRAAHTRLFATHMFWNLSLEWESRCSCIWRQAKALSRQGKMRKWTCTSNW